MTSEYKDKPEFGEREFLVSVPYREEKVPETSHLRNNGLRRRPLGYQNLKSHTRDLVKTKRKFVLT